MPLFCGQGVGLGNFKQADHPRAVVVGAVVDVIAVGPIVVEMTGNDDPLILELRVAALDSGDDVAVGDDVVNDVCMERHHGPDHFVRILALMLRGTGQFLHRALRLTE